MSDSASLSESHNSDGTSELVTPNLPFQLSGSQKKTAYALRMNVERMVREAGMERVGFLTLTVGTQGTRFRKVWDASEASRRFNNLNRKFLPLLLSRYVVVTERHADGSIHFHLVGALRCQSDIRAGFDFDAVKRREYSSACHALRRIWALLRRRLPEYGFGRAELMPLRKVGAAVAAYVAKYVEKNLFNRLDADHGKKLVRYGGWKKRQLKPNEFSWATPGATIWRKNARVLAGTVGERERDRMPVLLGPRWAFRLTRVMGQIQAMPAQLALDEILEMAGEFVTREVRSYSAFEERGIRLFNEKGPIANFFLRGKRARRCSQSELELAA